MTAESLPPWSLEQSAELDQRDAALPPSWIGRPDARAIDHVGRSGMHRSDGARTVAAAIAKAILGAKEMVVLASFLFGDPEIERAIEAAARRGVRVYLLIASEARLAREPRDDAEFDQKVVAEHKALLQRIAGWVLIRSSLAFHAKLVLVDPHTQAAGWLLTANLTQEALERNEEIAVELTKKEIASAFECVRWAAWEAADHQLVEPGDFLGVKALGRVQLPSPASGMTATLCGPGALRRDVLDLIEAAEREIIVSSFGFDLNHAAVQRLVARAQDGLKVTVLARTRPAAMPALLALRRAGARVLGFRWLHAKAVWTDRGTGIVMSANLEPKGLDEGFEMGVHATGERAVALRSLLDSWIEASKWELQVEPKVGGCLGPALVWTGSQFLEIDVVPHAEIRGPAVVAASADRLDALPPAVPRPNGLPVPAHRLTHRWSVEAPKLAPRSKPIEGNERRMKKDQRLAALPRFRESSGRLVVAVRDPAELERARAIVAAGWAQAIVVREARA